MNSNHLIDLNDITKHQWEEIVDLAIDIYNNKSKYNEVCKGKILATLFYEPSTRTQMSFQTAMLKLGGNIIGFDNPQNSSVAKGENLVDTINVISNYADIIAMRHPVEGSALAASLYSECPVINAGDGGHLHPTQTLTDLVTLKNEIGDINNLTVGICGDLKNGRTVHSLIKALSYYDNIKFALISTKELELPKKLQDFIISHNCSFINYNSIEEVIGELDVLYMTRIQKERFETEEQYNLQKNVYILDKEKLKLAKENMIILHPLPRVDEIAMDVDSDKRALYFKQARYGVYARMALIITLLSDNISISSYKGTNMNIHCNNKRCVTQTESYLSQSTIEIGGKHYCEYCDQPV